tara:strand:+ start:4287 stop:4592 length:306 start_codon:yes stop_codon:yes gene_type:complete
LWLITAKEKIQTMPSIKSLKKEINNRIGEIIEDVYALELSNPKIDFKESDQIIDKAISIFDDLIFRIHKTKKDSKKDGFKLIKADLTFSIDELKNKLSKLI